MKHLFKLCIFLIPIEACFGADPIVLTDQKKACLFTGHYIDLLEDPSHLLTIEEVSSMAYSNKFINGKGDQATSNDHLTSTYWLRLCIIDSASQDINPVLELYEFRLDYFEIYYARGDTFEKYVGGALFPFKKKSYHHKNFIYNLPIQKGKPLYVYIKAVSTKPVFLIGMVRSFEELLEYATTEYFMLSLFYGVLLAMVLYNTFLFLATGDRTYFFYVLYVLSAALFALSQDGLGFEYVWPDFPELNEYISLIGAYSMVVWVLLYSRQFLNTDYGKLGHFDKVLAFILILRTIIFIAGFVYPSIALNTWIDILAFLFVYLSGIVSLLRGNKIARFFVLAFTLFFIGFSIQVINKYHTISFNLLVQYSFNIGSLCEMVLLSLALADRIKMLTVEKEEAQSKMILQFQENEKLKDSVNQELERRVSERSKALEDKNKELDTFVYKSSHDIKGPLKSIIGLTSVGLHDAQDAVSRKYFEHILNTSQKLDLVVDHLLAVMEIKESAVNVSEVYFEDLVSCIFQQLKEVQEYRCVKIYKSVEQRCSFFSDEKIILLVLKDIISNALKSYDPSKPEPQLRLDFCVNKEKAILSLKGNGKGIKEEFQKTFFDVFQAMSTRQTKNQLGFYFLKIYIEKIQGMIHLESKPGEGAAFTIELKNLTPISLNTLS